MSSKVIVNIPPDPFQQQINKKHQEIVNADRPAMLGLTSTDPVIRANQLEQNIRFLQEQHQIMLTGLHTEIEILRQKNRDLQFQMVFSKGVPLVQSSPSSDEEFQRKFSFSPGQVNITPLQVEILERNVAELRTNLSEARTRNVYLQGIIDEQKKKIAILESEKSDVVGTTVGKKVGKENVATKSKSAGCESTYEELQDKLEDADRLIRRLRRENEEQRKEIVSLRSSPSKGKVEVRRGEGNNSHRSYYRNGQAQTTRFPPLHNQTHWRNSFDNHLNQGPERDRESNRLKKEAEMGGRPLPALPYLRDRNNASTSTGYSNPAYSNYQGMNHKRGFYYHRKGDDHRANGKSFKREQSHQQDSQDR